MCRVSCGTPLAAELTQHAAQHSPARELALLLSTVCQPPTHNCNANLRGYRPAWHFGHSLAVPSSLPRNNTCTHTLSCRVRAHGLTHTLIFRLKIIHTEAKHNTEAQHTP